MLVYIYLAAYESCLVEYAASERAVPFSLGAQVEAVYSCNTQNTDPYEVHVLSIYEPPGTQRAGGSPPTAVGDVLVRTNTFNNFGKTIINSSYRCLTQ